MLRTLLLCTALSLPACPKAPPRPAAATPAEHDATAAAQLATRARALQRALDEQLWAHWTTGTSLELEGTYAKEPDLFTLESLATLDRVGPRAKEEPERRSLSLLRHHFASEYIARELGDYTDAVEHLRHTVTFSSAGKDHPLVELERLLANERNTLRRRELFLAAAKAATRLEPAVVRRQQRKAELRTAAGYESPEAFAAAVERVDLDLLGRAAEELLRATDPAYRGVLERLARRELRLPTARVARWDLPRMFRVREVEEHFPADRIVPQVEEVAAGLGLGLDQLVGVTVLKERRPQGQPRPLALAVELPGDVRYAAAPKGGVRDQGQHLHELGHLLHAALTTQRDFALSRLGGSTASAAYGALFEQLTLERGWLKAQAGLEGPRLERHLFAAGAWELFLLRRDCGAMLVDLELARAPAGDPSATYQELMARALGTPSSPEDAALYFLLRRDEPFGAGARLASALLADTLKEQLAARFGPSWWSRPEAGALLRSLFAQGTSPTPGEFAAQVGAGSLSAGPTARRLLRLVDSAPSPSAEPSP
jgi:hypothetical protein